MILIPLLGISNISFFFCERWKGTYNYDIIPLPMLSRCLRSVSLSLQSFNFHRLRLSQVLFFSQCRIRDSAIEIVLTSKILAVHLHVTYIPRDEPRTIPSPRRPSFNFSMNFAINAGSNHQFHPIPYLIKSPQRGTTGATYRCRETSRAEGGGHMGEK